MATTAITARTLTEWETAVSESLSPLGFVYWAQVAGGGYWFDGARGLQLTYDMSTTRGARFYWTLKWIDGLKMSTILFSQSKRTTTMQASEIASKLAFLSRADWKKNPRWDTEDLS